MHPETRRASSENAVAEAAASGGARALERFAIRLFQPVQPMLAHTAAGLGEALGRLGEASIEYKLAAAWRCASRA